MTGIIFDLDRTLIDVQSYTDYSVALADVESAVGSWAGAPTPETDWDRPTHQCMAILVALSGDPRWSQASEIIEGHELVGVESSVPMPGLHPALQATADLRRAVVTLLPARAARAAFRRHGVNLSIVVGRRQDLRPKPAADQLLEACRLMGAEPAETVMIGDSSWDQQAAAAAGCRFVGVHEEADDLFPDALRAVDLAEAVGVALADSEVGE